MLGLLGFQARTLGLAIGLRDPLLNQFVAIAHGLYATMKANDADLVEVNPLAIVAEKGADGTATQRLVCLDAKITLDDSGLTRHPRLEALRDLDEEDPTDAKARRLGINFIHLDGTIGCMVNGAGLAMTTMDLVKHYGGEPANFLDVGGGARHETVRGAMELHPGRPQGQGHPGQHLRRDHARRRGGRGSDRGPGPAGARSADGRPDRRHERRRGGSTAQGSPLRDGDVARRSGREGSIAGEGGRPMSILVGCETRLVVQGITGREGEFHTRASIAYGTRVVAGTRPGKGGQTAIDGTVPIFDTVAEAVKEAGANTSVIFIPASGAPDAILEAVDAGIGTIVCITEGIPALDMIPVVEAVRRAGARLIGPNCPGVDVARPGEGGHHPGLDPQARPRRRGLALGHADLRGRPGHDRRRPRPVDVRRDRRRPDHRHDLPRRPQAVPTTTRRPTRS